jgi:hypothetical protein
LNAIFYKLHSLNGSRDEPSGLEFVSLVAAVVALAA